MTATRLTVGTFNIHHGVGTDGRLDIARTADTVARLDADVVALQEVDRRWSRRSGFADQARSLADSLEMHLAFGAAMRRPSGHGRPGGEYGVALLSRHPVAGTRNVPLPCPQGGEQRTMLLAELQVPGVTLRCVATHLQHRSATERRAQAQVVDAAVAGGDGPTVLLGDLNAGPGSPELETLTRHLVDAWPGRGEGEGLTYPARRPTARIDYVLVSPTTAVERVRVADTDASDHRPVTADLLV